MNGSTLDALSVETGLNTEAIRRHLSSALQSEDLLLISDDLLFTREAFLAAAAAIMTRLQTARPVKSSELRSQTALSSQVFDFVISSLAREQKIQIRDEMVSMHNLGGQPSAEETERLAAIAQAYEAAGLASPSVVELAHSLNLKEAEVRRFVTALQRDKTIVRMGSDDLFVHIEALKQLAARVTSFRGSLMDVARFKELTGLSRKYAIPLLEYLDRQRITLKQGDQRLVL
jgi:selenocysteine-specific elongation factor